MTPRAERGQAAVAAVAIAALLTVAAAGLLGLARSTLAGVRAGSAADAAALAGARTLLARAGDLLPRRDPVTRRTLPPRLTRSRYEELATESARREAAAAGAQLVSVRFDGPAHGPGPTALLVEVRLARVGLPHWLTSALRSRVSSASARAGYVQGVVPSAPGLPRAVELAGVDGVASAVIAAAEAQLGWPYVWGGESRAEGGFDCSGLVDFALAAAGVGVGRPTAAGLQALAAPVPLGAALLPGDLVFVGAPAHHVGLYVGGARVIEAPHTGATVRLEPLAAGGWTSAGRLPVLAAAASPSLQLAAAGVVVPTWVPDAWAPLVAEAASAESVPASLLAAQLEAESGFDAAAVSPAGAQGAAQFMPATWAGSWNPYRGHSPFAARFAVLAQARYLARLLRRAGGDVPLALAAYNAGWTGAQGPWPDETRAYVAQIMRRFAGPASIAPLPGDDGSPGRPEQPTTVRLLALEQSPCRAPPACA
jgi:cell wall-associated NlpC family hydrolase